MRWILAALAVGIGILPACNPTPCISIGGPCTGTATLAQRDDNRMIVGFPTEQVDASHEGMGLMRVGQSIPLQAQGGNGIERVASWMSSDPRVASVAPTSNLSGMLGGVAPGSTTITADLAYSDGSHGNASLFACQKNSNGTTTCFPIRVVQVTP